MSEIYVEPAPAQTPLFKDLNVRELLRGNGNIFRFILTDVWARWFDRVFSKVNPIIVTAVLDFPNTLAQTSSDLTVTVNGAATDLYAEVVPPPAVVSANSFFWAFVSSANVVTVRFCNFSASAINPASGTFTIIVRP